jgi:hypothetical protein
MEQKNFPKPAAVGSDLDSGILDSHHYVMPHHVTPATKLLYPSKLNIVCHRGSARGNQKPSSEEPEFFVADGWLTPQKNQVF